MGLGLCVGQEPIKIRDPRGKARTQQPVRKFPRFRRAASTAALSMFRPMTTSSFCRSPWVSSQSGAMASARPAGQSSLGMVAHLWECAVRDKGGVRGGREEEAVAPACICLKGADRLKDAWVDW